MKRVFVTAVLILGIVVVCGQVQAESVTLYTPSTASASSEYGAGLGVQGLFDGAVTVADIGTSNNVADQYACNGSAELSPTVAMDFGSSLTFNTLVYCQRASFTPPGGPTYTDWVTSMDLWFGSSAFSATIPATIPGPADETLLIGQVDGLVRYDFASAHTGQYVLARLNWSGPLGSANPGGRELLLGNAVPEPSALMLLTGGLLSLLAYAWRKGR